MNKNIKIAKQLIKLAKSLVAGGNNLFPELHDVQVTDCYMSPAFESSVFDLDYTNINDYQDGTYLYGKLQNKKPIDVFDMSKCSKEFKYYYGDNWHEFFSEISNNMNNATRQIPLKKQYAYYIAQGNSQSDLSQIIYDKSEVSNPEMFDEFLYDNVLTLHITIDDEQYNAYDFLNDISYYDKDEIIKNIQQKLGNDEDLKQQLEQLLPDDNDIHFCY